MTMRYNHDPIAFHRYCVENGAELLDTSQGREHGQTDDRPFAIRQERKLRHQEQANARQCDCETLTDW